MINYMMDSAKEYIKGTNGKTRIAIMEDISPEAARLYGKLKNQAHDLSLITGSLSHNVTRFDQLPCLQSYLKTKAFDATFDLSCKELTKEKSEGKNKLIELLLFVKYEVENPGRYTKYISDTMAYLISKLGDEQLRFLIQELSQVEGCAYFNMIEDYLSLQSLELVRTRYLQNSFQIGRNDGYIDRSDGEQISIRNPETMEDEDYIVENIKAKRADTGQQEQSLLGKLYLPCKQSDFPMVYISWRGSQNKESWLSDTQIAPGYESYVSHEAEILTQISDAIDRIAKQQGQAVHLMISGHSLGASLSQNNYQSIQRALCRGMGDTALTEEFNADITAELKGRYRDPGSFYKNLAAIDRCKINPEKIASMHLGIFNSPGVLDSVAKSSNQCSKYLTSLETPVEQYGHCALTHGDVVQKCSSATILTHIEDNGAHIEMFYFDNGQAGQASKMAAFPATIFAGSVYGTIFPGVGSLAGALIGAALGVGILGYGLLKGHTETFLDEKGSISQTSALKEIVYASSKNGQEDIAKIKARLHDKALVLQMGVTVFSNQTDLLGKRAEVTIRHAYNTEGEKEIKEETTVITPEARGMQRELQIKTDGSLQEGISPHVAQSMFQGVETPSKAALQKLDGKGCDFRPG